MQEQRRKRESTGSGFLQEDKDTQKSRHSSSLSSPRSEKLLSSIENMNKDPEKLTHSTHFQENIAKYSPGIPTA